jgi:ABC-2 type transport system ATP-binding protein
MSVEPAVQAEGLRKAFGKRRVLVDLDLELPAGSTTVLLGRNGAGKTTLLRVLAGLYRADGGRVRVVGLDPARSRNALSERVGFIPDAPDVWPWMTAAELYRFLEAHHPRWNRARCAELVRSLAIPADTPFGAMSRGEAMKALLVGALSHDPEVLLLDEPFAGLDPVAREDVLRAIVESIGTGAARTTLLSTHDLDVACRVGERALVLADGRLVESPPGDDGLRPSALREALASGAAS